MATQVFFDSFTAALISGAHDFANDTLALVVCSSANQPDIVNDEELTDLTIVDIESDLNGDLDLVTSNVDNSSGVIRVIVADKVIEPTTGSVGPFRHLVLYNKTTGGLISTYDLEDNVTVSEGTPLTFDFSQVQGAVQIRPQV